MNESERIHFKERIKAPYVVYVESPSDPETHILGSSFTQKERAKEYMKYHALRRPILVIDPNNYI